MQNSTREQRPLARKEGLVVRELPGEVLIYDLERDRAFCLNETAAWVWRRCDGRTTPAQMAKLLGEERRSRVSEELVWFALQQLSKDRLLEGRAAPPPRVSGMSRRQLIRSLGIAAAVGVPLVTSLVVPTSVLAGSSCGTCSSGGSCSGNPLCNCPGGGGACF
ncbi:MAG TPA: PqqD family protein [Pyrinomonadaceae bacterium]|jgi:hypothetical protein